MIDTYNNPEIQPDEVILFEGKARCNAYKGKLFLTLTTRKILLEAKEGMFSKERYLVDVIDLSIIKFYNEMPVIERKDDKVELQTMMGVLEFSFWDSSDARQLEMRLLDLLTGTTAVQRAVDKVGSFFKNLVR